VLIRFWLGCLSETDRLEDLGVDGRVWIGLSWLRIGKIGGML